MKVSAPEALEALAAVRAVQARTRRALALAGGGQILMIWGLVWLIGYLGTHVLPWHTAGRLWGAVDLLGIGGTIVVVMRSAPSVRDPMGPRIGLLWISLLLFGGLWIWVAQPTSCSQVGFLLATFAMFGYVVMGLWLDMVFLVIGLTVTAVAALGYILFQPLFNLWMAFLGGGTLFGSGVYILRRWR